MNCPECQTLNPEGARFCFNCGKALSLTCRHCGAQLPPGARFCMNCGQPVAAGVEAAAPVAPSAEVEVVAGAESPARQPPNATDALQRYIPAELLAKLESARHDGLMAGERRVVTILFCDVKGSTAAAAKLDPEDWAEIMNGAFEHMIGPVYRYEGTVARLMGDGLLAFFGAPIAHEDDPQRAVLSGLAIVTAISDYAVGVQARWAIDFSVRVGINTGLVVVGAVGSDLRVEYTALGDTINLAARMEQTAEPGMVQIAEPTYRLVAPLFDVEPIEALAVKGRASPVRAFRVLGAKAKPGSLRGIAGLKAPLIGREAQMDVLRAAVAELQEGRGQIVSIMGEAGLGKSRLIAELQKETDSAAGGLQWLEGSALSYESTTPFGLFADVFRRLLRLKGGNGDRGDYQRVKERLEGWFPKEGEAHAPFLATMLGVPLPARDAERVKYMEPPQLRAALFGHVCALLERMASAQPLVLVLDDLHWADPTSLELLQTLLPLTDRAPLMVLAALRPRPLEAAWQFHESAARDFPHRYRSLALAPLQEGEARDLLANLLMIEDLPAHVRQTILDKSEGNPFFVEEIIRSLLDSGLVLRENGHWRATQEVLNITIPDTLNGVITARLDRLEEPARQALQAASVLGREFSADILSSLLEGAGALEGLLAELQRRRMIQEKGVAERRSYLFKHVLTQEAAYNSILLSNRRELHRRAAESLIARQPEQSWQPEQPAEIARHLLEARQPARALPYLVDAGNRAARAYATAEAITFYDKALELQAAAADLQVVFRAFSGLGGALTFANRLPEALETYGRMLVLAEMQDDPGAQITALNKLAEITALRLGDFQQGEQLLARVDDLVQVVSERSGIADAALLRCRMCTARADFESVIRYMGQVIAIGEESGTVAQIAMGLEHVSTSLVFLARFDEAEEMAEQGLALMRELGDREHEAWMLGSTLPLLAMRHGDFEAARNYLDEGVAIAARIGAIQPLIMALWLQAEIARNLGEYEIALDFGRRAVETALPLEPFMPFMVTPTLSTLGTIYLEISPQFIDKVSELHLHAMRLLENPAGMMMGGAAWAQLGFCALVLGDLDIADEVVRKGLDYPTMFTRLERPRLLAVSALLACKRGQLDEALKQAQEALVYAEERGMRHVMPFVALATAQVYAARNEIEPTLENAAWAEAEGAQLGMRPTVWQAQIVAAKALEAVGREQEAGKKRDAAREVVQEIGNLFEDEGLRGMYLGSVGRKIGGLEIGN